MSSRTSSTYSFAQFTVPWLVALTVSIAIVFSGGSQLGALLLLLVALPLCFTKRQPIINISRIWLVTLILPVVVSIPLLIGSGTGEALAGGARYFAAAITLIGLSRVKLDARILLRAASLSGMLAIIFNLDQLDEMRVNWGVGFLDSGYISVLLLGLTLAQFFIDRGKPWWRLYAAVGVVCLVIAVMKTGTRGAWPAMICVFLIQFVLLELSIRKKVLIAVAGLLMFVIAAVTVPSIKKRIDLTVYEVQSYYQENNHASSVGYRLDFWHIAMRCFIESPIWGVSYQRRSEIMGQFISENPASATIGTDGRSSSHNEILNALSKRGLLGAIAILMLYLVPMRFFIKRLRSSTSREVCHLSLAGTGMVITIIICGITEAPMMNVRVGTSYGFFIIFLYHLLSSAGISKDKSTKVT